MILVVGQPSLVDEMYYLQNYKEGWEGGAWTERYDRRPCNQPNGYRLVSNRSALAGSTFSLKSYQLSRVVSLLSSRISSRGCCLFSQVISALAGSVSSLKSYQLLRVLSLLSRISSCGFHLFSRVICCLWFCLFS